MILITNIYKCLVHYKRILRHFSRYLKSTPCHLLREYKDICSNFSAYITRYDERLIQK